MDKDGLKWNGMDTENSQGWNGMEWNGMGMDSSEMKLTVNESTYKLSSEI